MARRGQQIEQTRQRADRAARLASPWIDRIARAGYVAKGVVYAAIGVLAMREALGLGGTTTDPAARRSSRWGSVEGGTVSCPPPWPSASWVRAAWKLVQGVWTPTKRAPTPTASYAASATSGAA